MACRLAWLGILMASVGGTAQAQDRVQIAPAGNKVQLTLSTPVSEKEYLLESQARLVEGEEWAPLLRFRASKTPRPYLDSICGNADSRFFRLRQLLDAPAPEVSNFRLIDTDGNAHELYYQKPALAVLLVLAGANLESVAPFSAELDRVRKLVGPDNLPTWIISATETSERDSIAGLAKTFPPDVRVLQDPSQAVHRTLGSGSAAEVVLISTVDWSVAYRGPIEENINTGASVVQTRPLADAVSELVGNKPISLSRVAMDCGTAGIQPVEPAKYAAVIAPMLLKSCMPCHSPGNIAPWAMTSHAVILEFSKLMKSAVLAGEMPPWHADSRYQHFSNSKALASREMASLVDWIDRGSPRGDGPDPLAVAQQQPLPDWPLGKPDAVVSIDPQDIPASGTIDYVYLFAKSPFPNDVWLQAVSVKPGERSVVHHCLVFKGGSLKELLALQGGLSGYFAGYVPGMDDVPFPAGTGKLLKKTDTIVFQMHYTASGKAATDRTQIGFYLAPSKPASELVTTAAYNTKFSIPPLTAESKVDASRTFARKSMIYELSPHMHFRGSRARFTLVYPDSTSEVLLNVPSYFFNWQALYRLTTPKVVPAGTKLICDGAFDNSTQNRFNPDPLATVTFGEQSWEEMFIGYVNFSEVQ
ncbi:MAG: hypothetical protein EXS31_07820 [Pedosphaera sp.]|nr:hypothetical protein [Pedosphaera sp.]